MGLHGLDIQVFIPDRGMTYFVRHYTQTSSGKHPASYPMHTGTVFPWGKSVAEWSWLYWPHLVPKFCMRGALLPHLSTPSSLGSSRSLLGCDAELCCVRTPTFERPMLPPSSGWNVGILPQRYTVSQPRRPRLIYLQGRESLEFRFKS
jgi:hypothetical protein